VTSEELRARTKRFALRVIQVEQALPRTRVSHVLGGQLLRSGTSVAANYRASCRARSQAEFISKMGIVEEEADETAFWLELLADTGQIDQAKVSDLIDEAYQLVRIAVTSINTARRNGSRWAQSAARTPQHGNGRRSDQSAIRNPQSAIQDARV